MENKIDKDTVDRFGLVIREEMKDMWWYCWEQSENIVKQEKTEENIYMLGRCDGTLEVLDKLYFECFGADKTYRKMQAKLQEYEDFANRNNERIVQSNG